LFSEQLHIQKLFYADIIAAVVDGAERGKAWAWLAQPFLRAFVLIQFALY